MGSWSQLPRGLRLRPAAARLVRLWVSNPLEPWRHAVANFVLCRYSSLRLADHSSI
jgi:hypothetical protein